MNKNKIAVLDEIYTDYNNDMEYTDISYEDTPQRILDYLEEKGYIESLADYCNGGLYTMTAKGVDFVENNYLEQSQNAGSIIINGSNNSISNSFNTTNQNIDDLGIDAELKELLINLINDLNSAKADKPTTLHKIRTFVTDTLKSSASNIIANQLTALIYLLLYQIKL